jgi:tetratricopeptide (TPR) repeat protein
VTEAHADGVRSVATGNNAGIVATGDHVQNVLITMPGGALPPIAETPAPPGTARLASRGAGVFVGREAELAALSGAAGAQVLVGLGGCGKSTLARRFAERRREHDNPVWWIDGRSSELIETGLAELAGRLSPVFAGLPVPLAAAWTRGWLATHPGWLLILDDVGGPDQVRSLLEELPDGRFLLTSRQGTGWSGLARVVRVGQLDRARGTELLELVIREGGAAAPDLTGAAELCERLGGLPLALEQAGAFIAQNAGSPRRYLDLLGAAAADLLDVASAGDPTRTVTRIWQVTFDRLSADPYALGMLRVLAWYAPTDIPRTFQVPGGNPAALGAALNLLAAYHLVTLTPETMSVHPLVQEITRTPSATDPHRAAEDIERARRTATALLLLGPASKVSAGGPADWPQQRRVFAHIETIAARTTPEQDDEAALTLYGWAGGCLIAQGEYARAIRHLTRCVQGSTRLFGAADEATLHRRQSLAQAYAGAGEADAAARLNRETLADAVRGLGPAHRLTLAMRAAVAMADAAAGGHERAIAEMRALLEIGRADFADDEVFIDLIENNLAVLLAQADEAEEALAIYEARHRSLVVRSGRDDPQTLVAQHNLAFAAQKVGDLQRAIETFEDVLERRQRVLGKDHPITLASLHSLAVACELTGDHARTKQLAERLLEARERVLGPDHPETRDVREGLDALNRLLADRQHAERAELASAPGVPSTARGSLLPGRLFGRSGRR